MPFPIDVERIREVEMQLGRKLPDTYVASMTQTNGGNTPDDRWILHPIADTSDRKRLKRTANHILRETETAHQHQGFPKGALVIGENMENTLLLLIPDKHDAARFDSAVYSWHPFHRDVTKVVDDFADFCPGAA